MKEGDLASSLNTGDLVQFNWNGKRSGQGIILSDYTQSLDKDGLMLKNVYWFGQGWIRPIRQCFLEVISENR